MFTLPVQAHIYYIPVLLNAEYEACQQGGAHHWSGHIDLPAIVRSPWDEQEKGTTWALFMAEDILKSRANLQLADPGEDLENLDEEVDPSLCGATMEA